MAGKSISVHILRKMRFTMPVLLGVIVIGVFSLGYQAVRIFLSLHYGGYITSTPDIRPVFAGAGGFVREIYVAPGEQVGRGEPVIEVVVTAQQPPDKALIETLFRVRVVNARWESQQGGLRKILLTPDLRQRAERNAEFSDFLEKEKQTFKEFKGLLASETRTEQEKYQKAQSQLQHIKKEIEGLRDEHALLSKKVREVSRGTLENDIAEDLVILQQDINRYRALERKLEKDSEKTSLALVNKTLEVRNSVREEFRAVRAEMNALYKRLQVEGGNEAIPQKIRASQAGLVAQMYVKLPGDTLAASELVAGIVNPKAVVFLEIRVTDKKAAHYKKAENISVLLPELTGQTIRMKAHIEEIIDADEAGQKIIRATLPVQPMIEEYGTVLPEKTLLRVELKKGRTRYGEFMMTLLEQKINKGAEMFENRAKIKKTITNKISILKNTMPSNP